jgi:hypothetical protein
VRYIEGRMIVSLLRSQILWGAVLIAIGLIRGKSVFLGDFGILEIAFDAVGVFAIINGVRRMKRTKLPGG